MKEKKQSYFDGRQQRFKSINLLYPSYSTERMILWADD
jgi:hypothetical protein